MLRINQRVSEVKNEGEAEGMGMCKMETWKSSGRASRSTVYVVEFWVLAAVSTS